MDRYKYDLNIVYHVLVGYAPAGVVLFACTTWRPGPRSVVGHARDHVPDAYAYLLYQVCRMIGMQP